MNSTDAANAPEGQDVLHLGLALGLLGATAVFGLFANTLNVCILKRCRTLQNSFGYLCASHSVAEAFNLLICGVWTIVVVLFNHSWSDSFFGRRLGQAAAGLCLLTSYTVLLKALNRFTAILMPFRHRRWFTTRTTKYLVAITWMLALIHAIPFSFGECDFVLDPQDVFWFFSESACGHFMAYYIDLIYSCSIMAVVIALDFTTMCALLRFIRSFRSKGAVGQTTQRYDVRFFVQSCMTSLLQVIMLTSFHLISRFADTKMGVFLTTTFAWALCAALDGAVNCAFNLPHIVYSVSNLSKSRFSRANNSVITEYGHVVPKRSQSSFDRLKSTGAVSETTDPVRKRDLDF